LYHRLRAVRGHLCFDDLQRLAKGRNLKASLVNGQTLVYLMANSPPGVRGRLVQEYAWPIKWLTNYQIDTKS
jgi:hypothetical protein